MKNETNLEGLLKESFKSTEQNIILPDDLPDDTSFCRYCWLQTKKSFPIGIMKMLMNILVLVNFYFMAWYNDKYLTAGYGLTITCITFFFNVPVSNTTEVAGIYHSKHYGAKRYHKMYIAYQRGFGISVLLLILGCLIYIRLDLLLLALRFSPNSVALAYVGAWTYVPYIIVNVCNENFKSLMITLGYEKVFQITNVIQILLGAPLSWLFIWHFKLQIIGSNMMFFLVEIVMSLCYMWTYYKYPPEFVKTYREYKKSLEVEVSEGETVEYEANIIEYAKTPGFREVYLSREFAEFAWFLVKNSICQYIEYFGYETTTFLCGLYGNINIINGWFVVKIWMAVAFFLGCGFSNSIRTYVGIKIGKKHFAAAKKIAERGIYQNILVLLPIFWAIALLSPYISEIFSDDPQVRYAITISMTGYFIVAPIACTKMTLTTLLRFCNEVMFLNINSVLFAGSMPIIMTSLGFFVFNWGYYTLGIEQFLVAIVGFSILFIRIIKFVDWTKIQDDEFKSFKTSPDLNERQELEQDNLTGKTE